MKFNDQLDGVNANIPEVQSHSRSETKPRVYVSSPAASLNHAVPVLQIII